MTTVASVLAHAQACGMERLDAQRLLCHVLAQPRSWLLAHADAVLSAAQHQLITQLLARGTDGEPLAYLIGEHEFYGLTLRVSPAVLVPRADTETLVDWALELMRPCAAPAILDMGTGSGAIALALKSQQPQAQVTALDASPQALEVATDNAHRLQLELRLLQSDWWSALQSERFDLIVSNPPYIAGNDAHLGALRHEPTMALTPGGDGLGALRHIVAGARAHLQPNGWLLLEHGHDQAPAVAAMLQAQHFTAITTRHDLAGHTRCTGGQVVALLHKP